MQSRPYVFALFFLLLFPFFAGAQDTTEVPQGTVVVKRAPVPASFHASVVYFYPDKAGKKASPRISKVGREEIVFVDSAALAYPPILPAVPFSAYGAIADKSQKQIAKYLRANYPGENFDWESFFSTMQFQFAWDDSVRKDSAQVQVTVNADGNATFRIIPWKNADSATQVLQEQTLKKLQTRPLWYTARPRYARKHKRKNTPRCVAIITIHAYDPSKERLMPIEVIPK